MKLTSSSRSDRFQAAWNFRTTVSADSLILKTSLDQLIFDGAYPWWTVEAYAPGWIALLRSRIFCACRVPISGKERNRLQKRSIAVSVERDKLSDRPTRRGTVFTERPAERDYYARSDIPRQTQGTPRQQVAPQRSGDQRRAQPGRTCGQQEILHRRVDRTVGTAR